jgi:hypothetical protein
MGPQADRCDRKQQDLAIMAVVMVGVKIPKKHSPKGASSPKERQRILITCTTEKYDQESALLWGRQRHCSWLAGLLGLFCCVESDQG